MAKTKVSHLIDRALLFLVTAFFSIAVTGYFSRDPVTIITAGITSALAITALIGMLQTRKAEVNPKPVKETMLQFYLNPESFGYDTVFSALSRRYKPEPCGKYIVVSRTAVYPYLAPKALTLAMFCEIFSGAPPDIKRLVILAAQGQDIETHKTVPLLPFEIPVTVLDGEQTYKLLECLGGLPEIKFKSKAGKRTFKQFFAHALSPKTSKRYLLTALLLIGSSFIMPSGVYYIIVAAVCIALSVLAKIDVAAKLR